MGTTKGNGSSVVSGVDIFKLITWTPQTKKSRYMDVVRVNCENNLLFNVSSKTQNSPTLLTTL